CTDFADPAVYRDRERFFADLAQIYREEIRDLARAGCRYLQLDEVAVAMLCDPAIRAQVAAAGQDPAALSATPPTGESPPRCGLSTPGLPRRPPTCGSAYTCAGAIFVAATSRPAAM